MAKTPRRTNRKGVEPYRGYIGKPYQLQTGAWRFNVHAGNGKVLAVSSESYQRERDAERGRRALQRASANTPAINPS